MKRRELFGTLASIPLAFGTTQLLGDENNNEGSLRFGDKKLYFKDGYVYK